MKSLQMALSLLWKQISGQRSRSTILSDTKAKPRRLLPALLAGDNAGGDLERN